MQPHAATAPEPALYAASASGTAANRASRSCIRCAWASIDAAASNGLRRPSPAAVPGMNCAIPWAPAGDTANGLQLASLLAPIPVGALRPTNDEGRVAARPVVRSAPSLATRGGAAG